jgi:hypothetical protein
VAVFVRFLKKKYFSPFSSFPQQGMFENHAEKPQGDPRTIRNLGKGCGRNKDSSRSKVVYVSKSLQFTFSYFFSDFFPNSKDLCQAAHLSLISDIASEAKEKAARAIQDFKKFIRKHKPSKQAATTLESKYFRKYFLFFVIFSLLY